MTSIAANDEVEDEDVENVPISQKRPGYTAPASLLNDIAQVLMFSISHPVIYYQVVEPSKSYYAIKTI